MKLLFSIILFFVFAVCHAQLGAHRKYFHFTGDTIRLDSLTLVPKSLTITKGKTLVNETDYSVVEELYLIVLKKGLADGTDSIIVTCRFFPFDLRKEHQRKNTTSILRDQSITGNPYIIQFDNNKWSSGGIPKDDLIKNGSISRGISFGNNQDMVVNSGMNLQVQGKLTPDIQLLLAATDNTIPIQPDGNTQQLKEFDKVFIQLFDSKSKLTVGDFQLEKPQSHFLNFYKRSQGFLFENTHIFPFQNNKNEKLTSKLSGAVSRGKFSRNQINGVENNQGPYRLRGAENELFIIVLSGTEKIYIDGKLLQRGQENDYIIDYNTAELTFTAKQLITKDKRIIAEFQYSERNYNRMLYYAGEEYQKNKLKIGFHLFGETDNKNKPFQQELSDEQKKLLSEIGDSLNRAVINGAIKSEYNSIEVFYQKKDTLTENGFYTIYEYDSKPDTAYRLKFSYVGEGKGDYKQIQSTANGKVYQWIEPLGGIKQGNYEPLILLVTPKFKQMIVTNGNIEFGNENDFSWEGALSTNDLNTFSTLNSGDDNGYGIKFNYKKNITFTSGDSLRKNKVSTHVNYETISKQFSPIERFRPIEFNRDWNRTTDSVKNMQHIASVLVGLEMPTRSKITYTGTLFRETGIFNGLKHQISGMIQRNDYRVQFEPSLVSTLTTQNKQATQFYRHKTNAYKTFTKFKLGYIDEMEINRFMYLKTDSLLKNSYSFWERELNIVNADTSNTNVKFFYRERTDNKVNFNVLKPTAYAQNIGVSTSLNNKKQPLKLMITYRQLKILDTLLISNKPDNTLLSRFEYSPRLWKGFFQGSLFYESGFGLEQRKEYSFIQVAAGQGQYYWNDYNSNGIKELNEFEIAQFADQATFLKVFTPSNTYIKVAHHQYSASFYLRPSVFLNKKSGKLMKLASKIVSQTSYRSDTKFNAQKNSGYGEFFTVRLNDSLLINNTSFFRQSIFFNQSSLKGGFDYTFQDNKNKQFLINGPESKWNQQHEFRSRINFNSSFGLYTNLIYGFKHSIASFFLNRNYAIDFIELEPKLNFQPNTSFRASIGYKRTEKSNNIKFGNQQASINDFLAEIRYNKLSKGSLSIRADFLQIQFSASENSPVAFEMLNSLRPGNNLTWLINYQQNLNSYLQISFNYEGRTSPGNKIIHIGGAQMRAFF